MVRIFNERMDTQIAVHVKREPGQFGTDPNHIASQKISAVERGAGWMLEKVRAIGPHTGRWSESMMLARGIEGPEGVAGLAFAG